MFGADHPGATLSASAFHAAHLESRARQRRCHDSKPPSVYSLPRISVCPHGEKLGQGAALTLARTGRGERDSSSAVHRRRDACAQLSTQQDGARASTRHARRCVWVHRKVARGGAGGPDCCRVRDHVGGRARTRITQRMCCSHDIAINRVWSRRRHVSHRFSHMGALPTEGQLSRWHG